MQTQSNHPHQNKRQQSTIVNCSDTVAKCSQQTLLTILTHVSVPTEEGESMPLGGLVLSCPLMPLADQHLRAQIIPIIGQ
jgi:hypothetical protein